MEGLLRPVGPEDIRTYWIRRGAAILILLLLIIGLGFMIANIGRAGTPVAAEPLGQEPAAMKEPAPAEGVVEEEAVPASGPTTAPQVDPAPSAAPAPAQPAAEPTPTPTPAPESKSEAPLPPEPANTFHQTATPPPAPASAGPSACSPADLRVSVKGPQRVRKDQPVAYDVSVSNTSAKDCTVAVNAKTFELKVYSGTDRIWSSHDCVAGMPAREALIAPGRSLDWQMEWRADRSMAECKTNPEPMGSGTYVVTAQLAQAKPAQVVVQFTA